MLQEDAGDHTQHVVDPQHLKELPKGVVTQGEIRLGGHEPRNFPQWASKFQIFPRFRKTDFVEQVEQVALDRQASRQFSRRDCKQLLQVGLAGSVDRLGGHQTEALGSKELVLVPVKIVLVVRVEDGSSRIHVAALKSVEGVHHAGVSNLLIEG